MSTYLCVRESESEANANANAIDANVSVSEANANVSEANANATATETKYSTKPYISYCNNCSTSGHTFNACKFPITSVGIIAFRYNDKHVLEYLLIRRKDTIGYIEFIRGKYSINNKKYLLNIISEMTTIEKELLLNNDFDTLWNKLWGVCINKFRNEEKNARDKFELLKIGITNSVNSFNLQTLIIESNTNWSEPEWGFPKGRHNNLERDLSCGLREFEEETGYSTQHLNIIQNIIPYEEIFTGSNYKSYKHKYYVGFMSKNQQPKPYQETEISKIEWCNYEEASKRFRPYNLEKLNVLHKVNTLLNKYNIYNL